MTCLHRSLFCLSIGLVLTIAASALSAELKVTGNGFSVVLPSAEWQVVTGASDKAELVVLGPRQFGADRPTVTVVVTDPGGSTGRWQSPEEFRDGLLESLKAEGGEIAQSDYRLGMAPSVKATQAEFSDPHSDHLVIVAVHDGRGYCLLCSTPAGTLQAVRGDFDRLLQSFRFLQRPKGGLVTFAEHGFSMQLPESGWERDPAAEQADPSLVLALAKPKLGDQSPTFSVLVGDIPTAWRGLSALEYLSRDALRELGNAPGVRIGEVLEGALGAYPSVTIQVTGDDAEGEVVLVARERRVYQFVLSAPVGKLAQYRQELTALLSAVRFLPLKTAK